MDRFIGQLEISLTFPSAPCPRSVCLDERSMRRCVGQCCGPEQVAHVDSRAAMCHPRTTLSEAIG